MIDPYSSERGRSSCRADPNMPTPARRRRKSGPTGQGLREVQEILHASFRFLSTLDMEKVLTLVVKAAVEAIPSAEQGLVFLLDDQGKDLCVRAHHGYTDPAVEQLRAPLDNSIWGRAIREQRVLVVNDVRADPLWQIGEGGKEVAEIRSAVVAPLQVGGRSLGVLSLGATKPHAFRAHDAELLALFAGQASIAIENARLFFLVERAKREWERTFDATSDLIALVNLEGHIIRANKALASKLSRSPKEIIGASFASVLFGEEAPFLPDDLLALQAGGAGSAEVAIPRLGGTFMVSAAPLFDARGERYGTVFVATDITTLKQREAELRTFAQAITSIGECVIITNLDGEITFVNRAAEAVWGYPPEDLVGRPWELLIAPEHRKAFKEVVADTLRGGWRGEVLEVRRSGETFPALLTTSLVRDEEGRPKAFIGVSRDVTTERQLQQQLLQSDKLASLGQLISGVAHELNNPLTVVMGFSQLLLRDETIAPGVRADVEKIYKEADRARRIVQNLLTFARSHKPQRTPISINEVLERTLELRLYEMSVNNITVQKELDSSLPPMMGDFYQLQQVFLNIINNAVEAMVESRREGMLRVSTHRTGSTIRVVISDTGPGIPPEVVGRIFDPFFTTKEKGTGLGLSISYGIVQEHGGTIYVEPGRGQGATFVIELPTAPEEEEPVLEGEVLPVAHPVERRILVIDDEPPILDLLQTALSRKGFRVEVAREGQEALRMLEQGRFDLVISDLRMPNMDGAALHRILQARWPHLLNRVLFLTGDVASPHVQRFLQQANAPYLVKPFTIDEVHLAVAKILHE